MKYHVFARINPGDDLTSIGTLDADSDRLARAYARTTFDEEDWDRLVVVRQEAMLDVEGEAAPDTPRPTTSESPGGEGA